MAKTSLAQIRRDVRHALKRRPGKAFCDDCVAKIANVAVHHATLAAIELGATPTFTRDRRACGMCGQARSVTRSLRPPGR